MDQILMATGSVDGKMIEKIVKDNNQTIRHIPTAQLQIKNGMRQLDAKIQMNRFIDLLIKHISCWSNYIDQSWFEDFVKGLPILGDSLVYPEYAEYIPTLYESAQEFARFKSCCRDFLQLGKEYDVYASVLAYVLSTDLGTRPMIESLFQAKKTDVLKHRNSKYASREFVKYDLDTDGFYYYRMLLFLCLEGKTDLDIMRQIRRIIIRRMPDADQYVSDMGQYLKEDSFADAFFGPFLFAFQAVTCRRGDTDLIVRLILSIYELICEHGYAVHDTEPMFVAELFFALHSQGGTKAYTAANIILSNCKDAARKLRPIKSDNDFATFLNATLLTLSCGDYLTDRNSFAAIERLRTLPKKRVKNIIENFVVSELTFTDGRAPSGTIVDVASKVSSSAASALLEGYEVWSRSYTSNKELQIDFYDHVDDTGNLGDKLEVLSIFFNRFINHLNLELRLDDLSKIDKSFEKTEKQIYIEKESAYKQKCADLERECRNLRANDLDRKALISENAELKKKITELDKQASTYSDERKKDRKEIIALRNLVYELAGNLTQKVPSDKTISMDEMGEYLNKNIKGIIIGGHVNVHNKLDRYLPKWKKYSPETKITPAVIRNNDIVVIFSDYMSHSSYFGAIEYIRESDCRLLYIHNVNMEYVLRKIYDTCKEEEL